MYAKHINGKLQVFDTTEKKDKMLNDGYFEVPKEILGGYPKDYYKTDFTLKTNQELIDDKILVLSVKEKLVDDRIIDKSETELIIEGINKLPKTQKIVDGKLLNKTINELYTDKIIKKEAWLNSEIRPERNRLLNDIDLIHCNALNLINMSVEEKANWEKYKQALKDYPSKATVKSSFPSLKKL